MQTKGKTKSKGKPRNRNNTSRKAAPSINNIPDDIVNGSNDISWYTHNPALVSAAASVPFHVRVGDELELTSAQSYYAPGIMALRTIPAFGRVMEATDPINVASVKNYTYVRHMNSGHANYDAPDLMIYYLALGQAYSFHQWMIRIYGYLNTYSATNKYLPQGLASLDGIDFDDFQKHMPDFLFYINQYAVKLTAFKVPQNFDLLKRHIFMFSNLYCDSESNRSQTYMFVPGGFYKFDNTTSTSGTSLQWSSLNNYKAHLTYEQLVAYGNNLIATVFGDEDTGIMSGDVMKAYGEEATYKPTLITPDYKVDILYDREVLQQINCATVLRNLTPSPMSQSNGVLLNQQIRNISDVYPAISTERALINSYNDVVSPEEVINATRLSAVSITITGSTDKETIWGGTEIVTLAQVIVSNGASFDIVDLVGDWYTTNSLAGAKEIIRMCDLHSKFNYAPLTRVVMDGTPRLIGDVDNITSITSGQLQGINNAVFLSLYGV